MSEPRIRPQPGDWVRFYRDARLIIGVVQYVQDTSTELYQRIHTDMGEVRSDAILEVRAHSIMALVVDAAAEARRAAIEEQEELAAAAGSLAANVRSILGMDRDGIIALVSMTNVRVVEDCLERVAEAIRSRAEGDRCR